MASRVLFERFAGLGASIDDSEEVCLQKRAFVLAASLYAILAVCWGTLYVFVGLPGPAMIPYAYVLLTVLVLSMFAARIPFAVARTVVLLAWLLMPLVFQVVLGGFVPASAALLWSAAAPIGALVFAATHAARWAAAFVGVMLIGWWVDPLLDASSGLPAGTTRVLFLLNLGGIGLAVFFLLRDFLERLNHAREALRQEQDRSESLLLNVLPRPIAERLKAGEKIIADRLDEVSIVFADLVGFTHLTERLPADQVVSMLDGLVADFDECALHLGVEKIRTIGDSYMVVAGAPDPRPDHLDAAADMALAMLDVVGRHVDPSGGEIKVRIGIDCGPVVAGVMGRHKFVYDVWGDSVNTASRMESHGEAGRIQVTAVVYQRLRDRFRFEERGVVEVKGKGPMTTYFLLGRL